MRHQSELSYRRRINRVVAHVHAHLSCDLEGSTLADIAAMSRFHFHRVFSAMTGMTPAQYVLRMRLAAAVEALRGGRRKTMLEPTFRDLPERQVLCATERGAIDNDMSAAAQRAFGRLLPAVQALGLGERQTACLAICPDEIKGFDDPYDTLWQTWRAIYRDWLPSTGTELRDAAPFEDYVNDASQVPAEALITDIHIPVR